ncbi:MAG: chemotaxis protein CheW [Candidatus Tectimicrobiota bacterium]
MLPEAYATTDRPGGAATVLSVLVLRVGVTWLALPTQVCREVAEMRRLHTLPHRVGRLPLHLVNLRGELHLCLRLGQLLGLEPEPSALASPMAYPRLVLIEYEAERWVVLVDALAGVESCPVSRAQEGRPPLPPALEALHGGDLLWQETLLPWLDPTRLYAALRRELV